MRYTVLTKQTRPVSERPIPHAPIPMSAHNTWCTPVKVKFFGGYCVECGAKMEVKK